MRVKEWQGDVVFLHEVVAGAADRSYGIQVAKLAGLPAAVIERAKLVLAQLEAEDRTSPARTLIDDLPLFAATARRRRAKDADADDALAAALAALNPDEMSPREALEALYALKLKASEEGSEHARAARLRRRYQPQPRDSTPIAGREREAQRRGARRAARRRDAARRSRCRSRSGPMAVREHRRGGRAADARLQDQHQAVEHDGKQRDACR